VLRGSSAGASSREFAGFGPVDGGVRGIYFAVVGERLVGYTSRVSLPISFPVA
jgi:hypothetical protein